MNLKDLIKLLALGSVFLGLSIFAQEEKKATDTKTDRFLILGNKYQEGFKMPGSGTTISLDQIRTHSHSDVNRILGRVPGVFIREEDGYGLFPNISIRGVDPNRSAKVMILEDGIPAAPAPYSAPDAYFSPNAARMSGFEVIKGSSQVVYGPHTTGGAINYISVPIPEQETFYLKQLFGSDSEFRTHAYYGNTIQGNGADYGFLVELYRRENDGFKNIQDVSSDTGIDFFEPRFKFRVTPHTKQYQYVELKLGYTDLESDTSYLGLSEADFNDDPYDRYWASRFDQMNSNSTSASLRHYIEFNDETNLRTTVYYQKFHRNWYKIHNINGNDISAALGAGSGADYDALRGVGTGFFEVRANNRDYYLYGMESILNHKLTTGEIKHDITMGARYHIDKIDRHQWEDRYSFTNGTITNVAYEFSDEDTNGNRWQKTKALALFIQDEMALTDKLTLTPSLRFEHLRLAHQRKDGRTPANGNRYEGESHLNAWSGGLGFNYAYTNKLAFFGGIHQGVSTPSPSANAGASAGQSIGVERNISYELGARYFAPESFFKSELAFFLIDYDNLIVSENISTGGNNGNAGKVRTWGVELSGEWDPGQYYDWCFQNPWFVSATFTSAELKSNSNSADTENIFAGGQSGHEVPYIPEFQMAFGTGIVYKKFGAFIEGRYQSGTYTTAHNSSDSSSNIRIGKLDSRVVFDFSAYYQLTDNVKLLANVYNLFDEEYAASRHPHGLRAGLPLTATVGFEIKF